MSARTSAADFSLDTAVEKLGDGTYRGTVSPAWFGPPGPNGGFIAALILRAISEHVAAADRRPRSLSVHYLRPPVEGDVEIEVSVERSGRTATATSARMRQDGKVTALALCVLSGSYDAMADWAPAPPEAPAPGSGEPLRLGDSGPALFEQIEATPTFGGPPFGGSSEALTGGWMRTRRPCPLGPELLALYTDAWWPAPFTRLDRPSAAPTLDLTIHFRAEPPAGPHEHVLGRFTCIAAEEGLFEEDGELWSADGRLLAQSRQLALLRPWNP